MSFYVVLCHFMSVKKRDKYRGLGILCHFMSFYVILCHFFCHFLSFSVAEFSVIFCHFLSLLIDLCYLPFCVIYGLVLSIPLPIATLSDGLRKVTEEEIEMDMVAQRGSEIRRHRVSKGVSGGETDNRGGKGERERERDTPPKKKEYIYIYT